MFKRFASIILLLVASVGAAAQQRPMSPPDRAPVPLTDADQRRARAEELAKEELAKKKTPTGTVTTQTAVQIKVPIALLGRHISSGNPTLDGYVQEAAARHGLDPCLIFSVMRAESSFNRMAVSPKGASGLMQLMPETATRFGVRNIFDPRENVFGGAKYLRWLLDRFNGDVRLALAGYNAGEGAVEFYGLRIPPFMETQNYVRTIYTRYSNIHIGARPETVAAETLKPSEQTKEKHPTYNQIILFTSSTSDAGAKSGQ
ncbi:MAG TPA: lytic transglycosylase domain-containing protein [Blastocatellia bacterium]|nr:lytic transglycosylase domain-containing protein [Blastocatellia bacterium]